MNIKLTYILLIFIALFSTSCEYGRQAEEKLSEFNSEVEELDSLVNERIEKVTDLESILPEMSNTLNKADSIINDSSATLDSLNQKVNDIKNIFN